MYGLVSDAFIKLNVVLANGSAVTVSDNSHQDLFWATTTLWLAGLTLKMLQLVPCYVYRYHQEPVPGPSTKSAYSFLTRMWYAVLASKS